MCGLSMGVSVDIAWWIVSEGTAQSHTCCPVIACARVWACVGVRYVGVFAWMWVCAHCCSWCPRILAGATKGRENSVRNETYASHDHNTHAVESAYAAAHMIDPSTGIAP